MRIRWLLLKRDKSFKTVNLSAQQILNYNNNKKYYDQFIDKFSVDKFSTLLNLFSTVWRMKWKDLG